MKIRVKYNWYDMEINQRLNEWRDMEKETGYFVWGGAGFLECEAVWRRGEERTMSADVMSEERLQAAKNLTAIVYALQLAGFLLGITWLVAIIVNYVKKEDVKGTWLESHFRWQIRTFWFGLLWAVLGFLFMITIIGWFVGMFILMVDATWIIYRVVKGWLRLYDGKPMYVKA